MSNYETVFILTPVLSDEQTKEAVRKIEDDIKSAGASIKHVENWGLRKLAYPIQKKTTGFYCLVEFEAQGESIADIELQLKRDERVLRFLSVKMDKDHIEYAQKRRERLQQQVKA